MMRLGRTALPLLFSVTLLAGCASGSASGPSPAAASGNVAGETTSKRAVESFMRAVKAQDLQAMATAWGTAKGPARDQMDRETLEKRLIVIQCMLSHDSWSFLEDSPRLQAGNRHEYRVEVRKKGRKEQTSFTTVTGPAQRWYVEIVDVEPLRDFCS